MILDKRPLPVYMMGFPHGVQDNIFRTVESELEERALAGEDLVTTEKIIAIQLGRLKQLCRDHKIESIGYADSLSAYIFAIQSGSEAIGK